MPTLTSLRVWQGPTLQHDRAKLCALHTVTGTLPASHNKQLHSVDVCSSLYRSSLCPITGFSQQWLCLQLRQHLSWGAEGFERQLSPCSLHNAHILSCPPERKKQSPLKHFYTARRVNVYVMPCRRLIETNQQLFFHCPFSISHKSMKSTSSRGTQYYSYTLTSINYLCIQLQQLVD